MVNVLYLAFGNNPNIYSQVYFSMTTVRLYHPETPIHIVTDAPQYFKRVVDQPNFFIHHFPSKTIQDWMNTGQKKFGFRTKQKAIEWMVTHFPDQPVLYLDSDTFIYQPLTSVFDILERGEKAVMHKFENLLSKPINKTQRLVWKSIGQKTFASVFISEQHAMWNAGVLGIPIRKNQEAIKTATDLSDELANHLKRKTFAEQMSFSIVLSDLYGLSESTDSIAHYWGNKEEWEVAIQKFYTMVHFQQLTFEKELEAVKAFDFSSIPLYKAQRNTRNKLVKLAHKLFKDKNVEYLPIIHKN
ncbi:MAG: hypothetical protein LBH22_04540 [Bacteroidales bacterium]|jgi:hypothetical protein|nr:hypothetical protein [Bacteroidales bacterium]